MLQSDTVLLVNESEALLARLHELLAAAGHDVVPCRCFTEAKRYLETHMPRAIVTDVRLGAYNGLHLVLLAKQQSPTTTAIVYSSHDDAGIRQEAVRSGATYLDTSALASGLIAHLRARLAEQAGDRPDSAACANSAADLAM